MAIRSFSAPLAKTRRRAKPGATKRQREALQDRMEGAFKADFGSGIEKLRNKVSASKLEDTFRKGDYDSITDLFPWGEMGGYFAEARETLASTVGKSAGLARKELPTDIDKQLRLTTQNSALDDYLNVRTGALIENVKDNVQVNVQQAVRGAFTQGLTPRDVAEQIKDSIGLNSQQAQQLQNFQGTRKAKRELKERLQDQRAVMVARTEISFAANQGQLAAWQAAQDQGLIDENAPKVWVVDGAPCPKICDPMDGVQVPLSEPFVLPDGIEVQAPPAHPNCRCLMSIDVGDKPDSGRENYASDEEEDGEEEDGEEEDEDG